MNNKINIVHLIPSIGFGGGAENVVYNLFRTIDPERFQLTLLYWGDHEDLVEPLRATGACVVKLPFKHVLSLDSIIQVSAALRKAGAHLLHTHFMDADLLGFAAAKLAGVPMVLEVHSFPFPEFQRHAYRYRLMSWGVRRMVCVSQTVKAHIRLRTGIAERAFSVIYNGLDIEAFDRKAAGVDRTALRRELGLSSEDQVVGNVSRLIADKGQEFLIKALPDVIRSFPSVKLLIVGDGPLRGELEALAVALGIRERVVFAGKRTDIPELMGMMDVFVFPTFNEAFGICVLEAMAAEKPIIATNDAAIPEIISSSNDGLLVAPGSPAVISQALIKILSDGTFSRRLAVNARERVKVFSIETMTRAYEDLYTGLLNGKRYGGISGG